MPIAKRFLGFLMPRPCNVLCLVDVTGCGSIASQCMQVQYVDFTYTFAVCVTLHGKGLRQPRHYTELYLRHSIPHFDKESGAISTFRAPEAFLAAMRHTSTRPSRRLGRA